MRVVLKLMITEEFWIVMKEHSCRILHSSLRRPPFGTPAAMQAKKVYDLASMALTSSSKGLHPSNKCIQLALAVIYFAARHEKFIFNFFFGPIPQIATWHVLKSPWPLWLLLSVYEIFATECKLLIVTVESSSLRRWNSCLSSLTSWITDLISRNKSPFPKSGLLGLCDLYDHTWWGSTSWFR